MGRNLDSQTYSEYYDGGPMPYDRVQLTQFPVTSISRVATYPQPALQIQNTDTTSNQRATVAVTSTGLTLVRVASGVSTTNTLAFSGNATVGLLATAISALANGWTAQVQSPFTNWASADFRPVQGAMTAMGNGATLELYTEDLPTWVESSAGYTAYGWRLDADTGILIGTFPQGQQNIRIDYTAGFATIPADVQEACVAYVQDLYQSELLNNNVKSESLGPYSYTLNDAAKVAMSSRITGILDRYKDYSKSFSYR